MNKSIQDALQCTICEPFLAAGCRPVFSISPKSKIIIIGQAPGRKVHESGIPWDDKSGENLRNWLNVPAETFYNPDLFAILPMGFCYPGTGKSGDLPPRKECAPQWHALFLQMMKQKQLVLLIGKYAQDYYLKEKTERNLTETVRNYQNYLPEFLPLPHPSPRNNIWQKKNPWFETNLLPQLKARIRQILINSG